MKIEDPMKDQDVLFLLNELLEAERAGAVATEELRLLLEDEAAATLMTSIHDGESYWAGLLEQHIKRKGGKPSAKTGAFCEKIRAIKEDGERITFLNRGQNWVARKLSEALPRINDEVLHKDLAKMLHAHQANFARVEHFLAQKRPQERVEK